MIVWEPSTCVCDDYQWRVALLGPELARDNWVTGRLWTGTVYCTYLGLGGGWLVLPWSVWV